MKLFMANATKHHQEFAYRIPEFPRLFQQRIPPGEQVQIYQDSDKGTLEHILKQHMDTPKPFVVDAADLDKHRGFAGLIFSFDKPVPGHKIEGAFEQNDDALEEQGKIQRQEAAAALSGQLKETAGQVGAGVSGVEMQIAEETKKGENEGAAKLNETIEVVTDKDGKGKGKGNK